MQRKSNFALLLLGVLSLGLVSSYANGFFGRSKRCNDCRQSFCMDAPAAQATYWCRFVCDTTSGTWQVAKDESGKPICVTYSGPDSLKALLPPEGSQEWEYIDPPIGKCLLGKDVAPHIGTKLLYTVAPYDSIVNCPCAALRRQHAESGK